MSNDLYIMHYGVGHDKGGHSGRYPWGSGENPYQGKTNIFKIRNESRALYKNLKEETEDKILAGDRRDEWQKDQIKNNKELQKIVWDKKLQLARAKLNQTASDSPEWPNPADNKEYVKEAKKAFKAEMGREYNPNKKYDDDYLEMYLDSIAGSDDNYLKKIREYNEKKKNSKWDKALKEYNKEKSRVARKYCGLLSNQKINGLGSYKQNVEELMDRLIDKLEHPEKYY